MTRPSRRTDACDVVTAPIVILVGNFGSGKSEIAVNLAVRLAERGHDVNLVDLDVVKPYFRCRAAREEVEARGIHMVVPGGDRFYADLPIIVPEVKGVLTRPLGTNGRVVVDAGGDDTGARALGSLADAITGDRAEMLFVVNTRRPFAEDQASLIAMMREVETAARRPVTGLVANTHLIEETTPEVVREGLVAARSLAVATGVPLRFCAVLERLEETLAGQDVLVLPIKRYLLPPEAPRMPGRRRRFAGV
ncbi:MAG TPA: P-loop NTPase [Thermoanaerobaculaceae bacterium]|nr:P-loop NTPase [Thermoanaerobaculaceae bacterium]